MIFPDAKSKQKNENEEEEKEKKINMKFHCHVSWIFLGGKTILPHISSWNTIITSGESDFFYFFLILNGPNQIIKIVFFIGMQMVIFPPGFNFNEYFFFLCVSRLPSIFGRSLDIDDTLSLCHINWNNFSTISFAQTQHLKVQCCLDWNEKKKNNNKTHLNYFIRPYFKRSMTIARTHAIFFFCIFNIPLFYHICKWIKTLNLHEITFQKDIIYDDALNNNWT